MVSWKIVRNSGLTEFSIGQFHFSWNQPVDAPKYELFASHLASSLDRLGGHVFDSAQSFSANMLDCLQAYDNANDSRAKSNYPQKLRHAAFEIQNRVCHICQARFV